MTLCANCLEIPCECEQPEPIDALVDEDGILRDHLGKRVRLDQRWRIEYDAGLQRHVKEHWTADFLEDHKIWPEALLGNDRSNMCCHIHCTRDIVDHAERSKHRDIGLCHHHVEELLPVLLGVLGLDSIDEGE